MMELRHGESCLPCIRKFVGPALEKILYSLGKDPQRCGGCGRDVEKFKFTYWFPWPEEG